MRYTAYTNAKIYTPDGVVPAGTLVVTESGKIHAIHTEPFTASEADVVHDLQGKAILPGLIDVHTHGAMGYSASDGSYESLDAFSKYHAAHGTTSFLATTRTDSDERISIALRSAADAINRGVSGAEIAGIHLEGPFIDRIRAGAQDPSHIVLPTESLMARYQALSDNHIRLVTLAPEVEGGMDAVKWYASRGVRVSIGHSNATLEEVKRAVSLGASHTTHHFNGMSPLHHREPGVAGSGLMLPELTTEIIADGFHVRPELIKFLFEVKGSMGVCMITDSVEAADLPNGTYGDVVVQDGRITLADGSSLAGSSLNTLQAVRNVIAYTGRSLEQVLPSMTEVPARQAGISDRKGSLVPGKDADFIVVSSCDKLELERTYVRSREVWNAKQL